jgi:hypothetical protein
MITIQQHQLQEQTWDNEITQSQSRIHFFISGQGTGKTTYLLRKHKESPSSIILAKSYKKINDLEDHASRMKLEVDSGIGLLIPSIEKYCYEVVMDSPAGQQIMDGIRTGFSPSKVHNEYCHEPLCPYRSKMALYKSGLYDHYVTSVDMAVSRPLFDEVETVCIDETSDLFKEEWGDWIPQSDFDEIKTTFKTTIDRKKWMELNQSRRKKYKTRLTKLFKKYLSNPNDQSIKDRARETSIIIKYLQSEVILDVEKGHNNDVRLKLPSKMYRLLRHNPSDPPQYLITSAIDATKTSFIIEHLSKCTQILSSLTGLNNLNFTPEFHTITQFDPNSTEVLYFNVKSSISNNKAKEMTKDWPTFLKSLPEILQRITSIHNICRMKNNNTKNHKLLLITFKVIADKLRILQQGVDSVKNEMGQEYQNYVNEVSSLVQMMKSYPFDDSYIQHFGYTIKGFDKSDIGSVVIYGDFINNDSFQSLIKKYNTKPITTTFGFHSLEDPKADYELMNDLCIETKDSIGRSRGRCTVGYIGYWAVRVLKTQYDKLRETHFGSIKLHQWYDDDDEKMMSVFRCFNVDGFTTHQHIMNETGMTYQQTRTVLQKMMKRKYITYYTIDDFKGQGLSIIEIKNLNEVLDRLHLNNPHTDVYTILRYDKV